MAEKITLDLCGGGVDGAHRHGWNRENNEGILNGVILDPYSGGEGSTPMNSYASGLYADFEHSLEFYNGFTFAAWIKTTDYGDGDKREYILHIIDKSPPQIEFERPEIAFFKKAGNAGEHRDAEIIFKSNTTDEEEGIQDGTFTARSFFRSPAEDYIHIALTIPFFSN